MTKKNFVWFANWIKNNNVDKEAVNELKSYFKSINPKFQEDKFDDFIGNPYKILD